MYVFIIICSCHKNYHTEKYVFAKFETYRNNYSECKIKEIEEFLIRK